MALNNNSNNNTLKNNDDQYCFPFVSVYEQYADTWSTSQGALLDASNVMPMFYPELPLPPADLAEGSENQPPVGGMGWNNDCYYNKFPSQSPTRSNFDGLAGYGYPQYYDYGVEDVPQGIYMPTPEIPSQADMGYKYYEEPYYCGTDIPQASGSQPVPLLAHTSGSEVMSYFSNYDGELSRDPEHETSANPWWHNSQLEFEYEKDPLTYGSKASTSTSGISASTSTATAQHCCPSLSHSVEDVPRSVCSVRRPRKQAQRPSAPETPTGPCQWDGGCGIMIPLDPGQAYEHVRNFHLSKEEKAGSVYCKWANCRHTKPIRCLSLRRHLGNKDHLAKMLVCPECTRTFTSRADALTRHRKAQCVKCGEAFGSCLRLKEHKRTCRARLRV